jgi:hypothetical protein
MGCGCKNKSNTTNVQVQKENTQKTVQAAIQKTVEKYYEKK